MDSAQAGNALAAAANRHVARKSIGHSQGIGCQLDLLQPAGFFEPGQRTGKYRLGTTNLIANEKGDSRISFEDYALALADEIEKPAHERGQLSIGY